MGRLTSCLKKAKGLLSKEEIDSIIDSSEKYQNEGYSESMAESMAIVDFNESLNKELNDLKARAGIGVDEFSKPEVKTIADVEVEKEVGGIDISDVERNALLAEGYDNSTINKAVKEANELRNLPAKDLFKKLSEKGVFNLGKGDTNVERPDVGLATAEYNTTLNQLEKNKDTKTIEKLMNFIEDIKETGVVKTIRGTGGMTERFSMPLHRALLENSNPERGLTEIEEIEELEKEAAREQVFAETGQFQKQSSAKGDVQKVLDRVQKSMPKVNVVVDENLNAAGKVQGNTLTINPYYAGIDTPIHEAGHILIDVIGFNNKVIQSGINQLKATPLWAETKQRYPELNDEMLSKEVLAEAIGREGAGVFDKEVDRNKFMAILDYIYSKLKQLLGLDKNVAKSLAKQIISGIGTKDLTGTTAEEQLAKRREKSEDERAVEKAYNDLMEVDNLSEIPYELLLDAYNKIITSDTIPAGKTATIRSELLKRIGMNIFQRGQDMVKNDPKYSPEKAAKKDISWLDKHLKVLTHFGESFPEMKFLSDKFQTAYFDKIKESREKKNLNEKLAIEVIKDRNKKLGISFTRGKEYIQQLFGNQNYKFFDYLDNGLGDLITLEEAKQKGLSEAQINYLKFVREQIGERKGIIGSEAYDIPMSVVKTDKRFYESYQTENAVSAISSLLGNTHNINKVRISFTNPNTGKEQVAEYEEIEKIFVDYGKKGVKEKIKSVAAITKYNFKARRQLRENVNVDEKGQENVLNVVRSGDYSLDEKGQLTSRFDKPRDPKRAYSKDFYTAMQEFIDDTQHVKHISPLLPIINSIDYLNKNGVYQYDEDGNKITLHAQKKNVEEWLKGWVDTHIIQRPNENDPTIDTTLRFLRTWASLSTMLFNVPAQGMNLAIGIYNNWRKENSQTVAKGLARLFVGKGGRKLNKDAGYGAVNPIAAAIIQKYGASSADMDSNPIQTAGGLIAKLGFLGTKWGEFIVQGSGLLGKMSDEDFNSFEFKKNKFGVDELVIKDSVKDKEALEKRILNHIDEVSDVQGKYSAKDRRNIMNNEFGKALMQYKVWIPDWFRVRFGEKGSWTSMMRGGLTEIKNQIKDEGLMKTLVTGKDTQAVKDFKSNLKGLMTTALLMSFVHTDDDDDKKSLAAKTVQKALNDVLFVFDPNSAKFLVSHPVASVSKITELIDAVANLNELNAEKSVKDAVKLTPGKKVLDVVNYLSEEED